MRNTGHSGELLWRFVYQCSSGLPRTVVNSNVFFRRSIPGKISFHPIAHERLPGILIVKRLQSLFDGAQERFSAVLGKFEPGASSSSRVPRFNRIVQTAGSTHNWNGSVLQAVNLIEAARLIFPR